MVVDVPKDTADGALQHVAAKASGSLTTVDGDLYNVCDRVCHGIHGRYGISHHLPWKRRLRRVFPVKFCSASLSSLCVNDWSSA